MPEKTSHRLPDTVIPKSYDLRITPDLEKFTFAGVVNITAFITQPVHEITLHAADLEILGVKAWRMGEYITPTVITLDPKAETATFGFDQELLAGREGNLLLEITYTGILNDKMAGFYRSRYTDSEGKEKYLATTQFEATEARRALPCWDEPARKATFDVTLIIPRELDALSNMPIEAMLLDGDTKEVIFERTPVMSTYLLAFIVGTFECVQGFTDNGTKVRVYALPGKSHQGQFALETAVRVLEFYNEYFGIPYPLPKLDMVAIPDFAAGAMENWGLVTYRENAILIDATQSSTAAYQRVAEMVAHELAHQWFGNLVTMEWWTNLWLNEGFATWMGPFALNHLFPEWDIWTQFLGKEYAGALSLDGLRSTHPIEVEVGHPDEVHQIFDAISYSKGASIIRMVHSVIGADAFRTGLQNYLRRHAYANATTEDLWGALAETSGQPIHAMMDSWTKQPGYPLLFVSSPKRGLRNITQTRFIAEGNALTTEEFKQHWFVPVSYLHRGDSEPREQFLNNQSCILVPADVLKVNMGQIALARVAYTDDQWQALTQAVRDGILSPADRCGLVSDALSFTRAGLLRTDRLITLLSAYDKEDNYTVWLTILEALDSLDTITEETSDHQRLASFACTLLTPIAQKIGWHESSDEPHTTKLLRGLVMYALSRYQQAFPVEAWNLFAQHSDYMTPQPLNPNIRGAIYGTVARIGNRELLSTFIGLYLEETFQEEKVRLLKAMGQFTDLDALFRVLGWTFDKENVRPGDFRYVLSGMGSHAKGRRVAWAFLVDNWKILNERYTGGGLRMMGDIISDVCDNFARAQDAEVIERFFTDNPVPSATRAVSEALECIRVRAAWYERDKYQITASLPD